MKRIIVILLMLMSFNIFAQTTKTAKLKASAEKITIRNFNVALIVDDRDDTTNIGSMRAGLANKRAFVNLPNGAADAISNFINASVNQSSETDQIELHILELKVVESANLIKERATLTTKYGFFRNGKKIIDYSGDSYVESGFDVSPLIGRLVSQSVEKVLREFDGWWPDNRQMFDESKRDQLNISVQLQTTGNDPDEIIYNTARPLTINDFKGPPDALSKALAATYSGFSMQYELKGDHTGSVAKITIKPYFLISKSWMKRGGKVPYVLQHEQLHFDIATLKACELIIALKNSSFNTSDFKEQMNRLQKKYSDEMEQMQAAYDSETSHGIFKEKQNTWQARIQKELQQKLTEAGS